MRSSSSKQSRNFIRFSIFLLVLPVLYLGLWFSISADDSLSYFEQVQMLMSYFPESVRDPYKITLFFFVESLSATILSFYGYLKAESKKAQLTTIIICCISTLLSAWFGMTLI
ncbi:MAG: hypothetical protein CL670_02370 [Balneola sp.]|nr:hypothetical protein [Balneola sp.]MBE77980.1 hypothetical protein [Balneola sp.]HBX66507.1 hypothetical protein [Balneolaceae bacterium]